MSIRVEVADIPETAAGFGLSAFLLTTGDDLRPNVLHVPVAFEDGLLTVPAGRSARANATARPLVGLVWPPREDGYTLIVDGELAGVGAEGITIKPTNAVLHRPAAAPGCS